MRHATFLTRTRNGGVVVIVAALAATLLLQAPAQAAGEWTETGSLQYGRYSAAAATLPDGRVLLLGSTPGNLHDGTTEIFNPATGSWSMASDLPFPMSSPHTATLQDGTVLAAGGANHQTATFDPSSNAWTATGPWASGSAHIAATATLLQDGKVLLAGGIGSNASDVYDPATRTYTFGGTMSNTRAAHAAILLDNGKVLLAGGDTGGGWALASADLYDPATGTFTPTGSMNVPRIYNSMVKLPNGKILVAGGWVSSANQPGVGDPSTTAEIYDPATGQWAMTGSLHTPRYFGVQHMQALPDGRVLAAGAQDNSATSEVYDPQTGSWSQQIPMANPHCAGATAKLLDGRVLLAGGNDCNTAGSQLTAKAEIFTVGTAPDPAPEVTNLNVTPNPAIVNTTVTSNAVFLDTGNSSNYTAVWNWGDGTTTTQTNATPGPISASHTYSTAGVYTVSVKVTDSNNGSDEAVFEYLSVYNPTPQSMFTGVRQFDSPYGAVPADPAVQSQVKFGVYLKYQDTLPQGKVSFNFRDADIEFKSQSITSLVTVGGNATARGTGTVNDIAGYSVLVTARDGDAAGGVDAVRFQIKHTATGTIMYDSQPGAPDTATPTTPTNGQVIIH